MGDGILGDSRGLLPTPMSLLNGRRKVDRVLFRGLRSLSSRSGLLVAGNSGRRDGRDRGLLGLLLEISNLSGDLDLLRGSLEGYLLCQQRCFTREGSDFLVLNLCGRRALIHGDIVLPKLTLERFF